MSSRPAIEADDVSLAYRLVRHSTPTIHDMAVKGWRHGRRYEPLLAVDRVTFEVQPGEVFGVIGPNGSGKSTLLKILARVLPPTAGRVLVRGRIAPLIQLGSGFQADLTGYENILLYGAVLGQDARVVRSRAPAIAEWAGLTAFLDVPVRSYSTGMRARLAFAIASDGSPDVLIIDEAMAVGDQDFKDRSQQRIFDMIDRGATVVLVTHELDLVARMAPRALWLDAGMAREIGSAGAVVQAYLASLARDSASVESRAIGRT